MLRPTARIAARATLMLALGAGLMIAGDVSAHEKAKHETMPAEATAQADEMMSGEMMGDASVRGRQTRLLMPMMNPSRGRKLFASKGCVTCHSVNGVGGEDAVNLDAHSMMAYMNPFDFAARMWRGAAAMIVLQEEALGAQIEFTGDELADIIAFVHDEDEQHKFSEADIPPEIMPMMHHMHGEAGGGAAAHAEELGHEHAEGTAPHED